MHPEGVEGVHDAHLLGRRERHPSTAHTVAKGGVVELYVGHGAYPAVVVCALGAGASPVGVASASASTTSSHSR